MSVPQICDSCTSSLLHLFRFGFCARSPTPRIQRSHPRAHKFAISYVRTFAVQSPARYPDVQPEREDPELQQMSHTISKARRTFGDTLPKAFLSPEEHKLYERLYGSPSGVTRPQDVGVIQNMIGGDAQSADPGAGWNDILRENDDGDLEKVGYVPKAASDPKGDGQSPDETPPLDQELGDTQEETTPTLDDEFDRRFNIYVDEVFSSGAMPELVSTEGEESVENEIAPVEEDEAEDLEEDEGDDVEPFQDSENAYTSSTELRQHPLTAAGKWGSSPSTIQLPKDTFIDPISAIFSEASNKHLAEVAQKVFGGKALPNSTATPRPNMVEDRLKQSPIALEASQSYMGEMEANAYLAAIMPGAYATSLSCLVEVRKRLGSHWLQSLLNKEGGPRILDAGAGGAGVLAWREMLRSEWGLMHPEADMEDHRVPLGKATVITGSSSLRHRSSLLLDNTTFLPRLPDYNPSKDHPSIEQGNGSPRKQYDVILAPYTLWTLREDHMRKAQVQNFWSLLNPVGGVLVVIEKGVPRGFELVAGAREVLLKNHIASPGDTKYENRIDEPMEGRYREKEKGMIIAPCTSHGKCPMYLFSGKSVGRRDYCHFSQRYIRPPFLQHIIGQNHRNHEDVRFSFVAVQRGLDQRQIHGFQQGQVAEENAFAGYGGEEDLGSDQEVEPRRTRNMGDDGAGSSPANPLSFPRLVLPPIKRRGHIILDTCTPAGRIQRWTVPKSYGKRAFDDARKARWGDLWALGAKTRISRRLRIGGEAAKPRGRRRFEADERDPDNIREVGRSGKVDTVHRKGRKQRQKNTLSDEMDV